MGDPNAFLQKFRPRFRIHVICNTYQFRDYSKYDANLFKEEDKRAYRDSHFEIDLKNAYDLGCRIAEKARSISE